MFLWKVGRSFQTWEHGNNWPSSKTRFCRMLLLKTATNSSNNGYFPLNLVTWHVAWPVRSNNSTLKCSGRQNLTVCEIWFHCHYTFRNITNKLFSPVKAFDPGFKLLEQNTEPADNRFVHSVHTYGNWIIR